MPKYIDIVGHKYGRLTVLEKVENKNDKTCFLCECDCGIRVCVRSNSLRRGAVKSCGCYRNEQMKKVTFKNIEGQKFGKLTVVRWIYKIKGKHNWLNYYECICDCGSVCDLPKSYFMCGNTNSCGCIQRNWIGPNNPNYNHDLTNEDRIYTRSDKGESYNYFRDEVRIRDNFTCRSCNKRGGRLAVHHLNGWNWDKENRFNRDNAITLCKKCHIKFHSKYGNGNNTKEQFEEFLNEK